MLVNNALAVLGGTLMGLANAAASYEMLILGRFLIGAYSGTHRHNGPAQCPALLHHPWVWWEGVCSCLSPLFFPLHRADVGAGAHVCGGDCPHSPEGRLGDTQPTSYRHWHSDCPGDWDWPHRRIGPMLGVGLCCQ